MKPFDPEEAAELLRLTPALFCTATTNGCFRTVGPHWAAVLGVPIDELVGKSFLDYVHPDDHAHTIEVMSVLQEGEPVSDFVNRYIAPDGRILYLSWSAKQRGDVVYAVATDVTGQRREGLLAKEDAAKLELIEEISGVGYWRVQLGDVMKLHWSEQVFRIHGLEPQPSAPDLETAISYYHPDDRDRVSACIERAVESGEPFDFQLRIVRDDKTERQVVSKGIVQQDDRGEPVAIMGVFHDVTDRTLMQRRLFDQERLESVSLLAAGIAHEINNPLQYLTANMSLATRALDNAEASTGPVPFDRLRERLSDAEYGVAQVSRIVGDLRAFMSQENRDVVDVDLVDALRTAATMARGQLRHGAVFEQRVSELPGVRGDAGQLIQVIVNLLINAGHAVVDVDSGDAKVSLAAWTSRDGDAVIEVEDNGVGIPLENLSRIFEPFFTTRSLGDGSGLGLHVCRRIVDAMGGQIDVRSTPGRTTFRVTLPPAQPHVALADERQTTLPTLLVIDDDKRVARVVAMMCAEDFHTRAELDPHEALRVVRDEDFDVIICDVMMPAMNGWELLAEAEASRPGIRSRFVMMTGADAERYRPPELIGVPVLDKPFGHEGVIAALRAAMARSAEWAAAG